jgi:hypothetical protein
MIDWTIPTAPQLLSAFVVSLIGVGMRGFQHKNVVGSHYKLIAACSYLIVICDALAALFVVKVGILCTIPAGTGAAIGMVTSTWLHDTYIRKSS